MKSARTIYLVKRLEAITRARLEAAVGALGLTAGQYTTLSLLARRGEASSADLARQALITPQSMSEVIAALERKGLVERRSSDGNRRVLRITVSAEGRQVIDRAEAVVDALEKELIAALDPATLAALREAIGTALDHTG